MRIPTFLVKLIEIGRDPRKVRGLYVRTPDSPTPVLVGFKEQEGTSSPSVYWFHPPTKLHPDFRPGKDWFGCRSDDEASRLFVFERHETDVVLETPDYRSFKKLLAFLRIETHTPVGRRLEEILGEHHKYRDVVEGREFDVIIDQG